MSLNYQHQFNLLQDILTNHLEDCCGSVAECEQVGRLVKSLIVNQEVEPKLIPVLEEIYTYCQTGKNTAQLDTHINTHQEQLSQWVGHINSYS